MPAHRRTRWWDERMSEPTDALSSLLDGAHSPFIDYLGLTMTEVSGERVVGTWTAGPHLTQYYGIVHGGVHCSVVETLGSVGGAVWIGLRGKVVGVSNHTDFYRAARDGEMTSVAEPVHQGRSQQVWVVETRDTTGRLVSRGQVRLQNLMAAGGSEQQE